MKLLKMLKGGILLGIVLSLIVFHAPPLRAEESAADFAEFEDLKLIEYQIKVVRIDEADLYRLGLEELRLELGAEEVLSFITADNLVQMAGIAGRAMFQLEAFQTAEETVEIASTSVITMLDKPVKIKLVEEILRLDEYFEDEWIRQDEELRIDIMPLRSDGEGGVLTDLRVSSGDTSSVDTAFWSQQKEERLLGMVNWSRSTRLVESLRRGEKTEMTTYALYATHDIVDIEEERRKNILTMEGLSEMLWPELAAELGTSGHFQITSSPDLEAVIVDYEAGAGIVISTAGGMETVAFGVDRVVSLFYEDLRVGLRGFYNREGDGSDMELAPVIGERIFFDPYLEIGGSYYPLFYNLQRGRLETVHAFDIELALKYRPLSARLRYSSDLGADELRALLGYSPNDIITIFAGAEGSRDGVDQYIAGLRLAF